MGRKPKLVENKWKKTNNGYNLLAFITTWQYLNDVIHFPLGEKLRYNIQTLGVPEGGDCESERLLGACSCADGAKLPGGCDARDSSTWAVWNGTAASGDSLPPGLFLTCAVKPPPPAAAAPGPAPDADAGAATGSDGQSASADIPQEAPDAEEEGGGPRDGGGAGAAESVETDTHSDEAGTHSDEGAGTTTAEATHAVGPEKKGGKGGPAGAYTGAIVAASVISAVTTAAIVAGVAVAYKRRQRRKSHVRTTEAYEAMLTGTSYTPPMKAKAPLMSTVRRAFQQVFGRKQPDFQPTLENLEDGSALQEPAAPADDEIFTVQDLAQNEGNRRAKKWHKGSVHAIDKEMEMQERAHLLQQSPAKISKPDITTHELPLQSRERGEPREDLVEGADEGERPRTPPPTGGGQKRVDPDSYHRD
ncbi:hypothetical protein DUNSADRAFT_9876 [Dunaliella salina]|uniref:Uncharacterized protein n=1 Tax=Dunaliella salina TaxID=3046 RepID=A0ABQ7H557_DUNSA|nr:hypothetical protein DUNSADRAFT_9876 [Dunaliella salina]|eukprot:KAF5841995.1 hypothetical protein DUNSADRAFT_9876 [Dunaliella salina]